MPQKPKILVIPHLPAEHLVEVSPHQLAIHLNEIADVSYLVWHMGNPLRLSSRMVAAAKDLIGVPRIFMNDGLRYVQVRTWHWPKGMSKQYNQSNLRQLIERDRYDIVINSSWGVFMVPPMTGVTHVYHMVDLHHSDRQPHGNDEKDLYLNEAARNTDVLTAVSPLLVEYLTSRFHRTVHWVPNGVTTTDIRNPVPQEELDGLRRRHHLDGKYVFLCMGYLGAWMNIPFLLEAFQRVKSGMPNAVLIIVGTLADPRLQSLRAIQSDVIFTGTVPKGMIKMYLQIANAGLLPNEVTDYQHHAFHLKILEYSAARLPVVSTPLAGVKAVNLSNVLCVDPNVKEWADAMIKTRSMNWQSAWDSEIHPFDWRIVAQTMLNVCGRGVTA